VSVTTPTIRAGHTHQPDHTRADRYIDAMHGDVRQKHQGICRQTTSKTHDTGVMFNAQQTSTTFNDKHGGSHRASCQLSTSEAQIA